MVVAAAACVAGVQSAQRCDLRQAPCAMIAAVTIVFAVLAVLAVAVSKLQSSTTSQHHMDSSCSPKGRGTVCFLTSPGCLVSAQLTVLHPTETWFLRLRHNN